MVKKMINEEIKDSLKIIIKKSTRKVCSRYIFNKECNDGPCSICPFFRSNIFLATKSLTVNINTGEEFKETYIADLISNFIDSIIYDNILRSKSRIEIEEVKDYLRGNHRKEIAENLISLLHDIEVEK